MRDAIAGGFRRGSGFAVGLAAVLALAACSQKPPAASATLPATHPPLDAQPAVAPGPAPGTVLARAGDVAITVADADAVLATMPAGERLEAVVSTAALGDFVESLVDRRLMAAAARRAGLEAGPDSGSDAARERELAGRWLAAELLRVPAAPPAGIAAYYASHQAEFTEPLRVRVTRVVVPGEATAARVRAALVRGAAAGELREQAGTGAETGELWLQDVPGVTPAVEAALRLPPGAVSEVVPVAAGFSVLRIEERRPVRIRPLAEVEAGIRAGLDERARQAAAAAAQRRLRGGGPVVLETAALTSYAARFGGGG